MKKSNDFKSRFKDRKEWEKPDKTILSKPDYELRQKFRIKFVPIEECRESKMIPKDLIKRSGSLYKKVYKNSKYIDKLINDLIGSS